MHELSIAYSLVNMASAAAEKAGAARVSAVYLRLGALSGVVREALEFSFEIAAADTPLAGAKLVIEELPVMIYCSFCAENVTLPSVQRFRCPRCDTPSDRIVQGRELDLTGLEVVDDV